MRANGYQNLRLTVIPANLQYLAKKGITLSSYYGVTHPSEPNYVASIGGDYFGMKYAKTSI